MKLKDLLKIYNELVKRGCDWCLDIIGDGSEKDRLVEYIKFLNRSKTPLHMDIIYIEETIENVQIQLAFQYTNDYSI